MLSGSTLLWASASLAVRTTSSHSKTPPPALPIVAFVMRTCSRCARARSLSLGRKQCSVASLFAPMALRSCSTRSVNTAESSPEVGRIA